MDNLTSRQKQAIETKIKISKTALELFKHHPSEDVKVTDICKASGVSVGAFYHHFESKEAIIKIAYSSLDELIVTNVENREYESAVEKAVSVFTEATKILNDYGYEFVASAYKIMLTNFDESTFSRDRSSYILIADSLGKALENGEIKSEKDKFEITDILMAAGRGILFDWCLRKGEYNLTESMDYLINHSIKTLKLG